MLRLVHIVHSPWWNLPWCDMHDSILLLGKKSITHLLFKHNTMM